LAARNLEGTRAEIGKDSVLKQKDYAERENLEVVDLIADAPKNITTQQLDDLLWSQLLDNSASVRRENHLSSTILRPRVPGARWGTYSTARKSPIFA
jgi:hypothetical protein